MSKEIRELARLGEEGKGCELMTEIQEIPYQERMKVMKQIALQSQIDLLDNPQVPSLSFTLSTHGPIQTDLSSTLRIGDWSGIGLGGKALVTEKFSLGSPFSWPISVGRKITCGNVEVPSIGHGNRKF